MAVVAVAADNYGGRAAQRWVAAVLDRFGTRCHLCGHAAADSADHLVTRRELRERGRLDLLYSIDNGRPVHHKPCPVCAVRCNIRRKDKPLDGAIARDELAFFDAGP